MTRFHHHTLAAGAVANILACAGCASLPGAQMPDIAILEPYNGERVSESQDQVQRMTQFLSPDGSGIDRVTMSQVSSRLVIGAKRFSLAVSDSLFELSSDEPGVSFSLPGDGTPIEVHDEDGRVLETIALTWTEDTPVVRRTLPGIGWVAYRFELAPEGSLVVTHTAGVRNVRGIQVEAEPPVQLVFVRSTGS